MRAGLQQSADEPDQRLSDENAGGVTNTASTSRNASSAATT